MKKTDFNFDFEDEPVFLDQKPDYLDFFGEEEETKDENFDAFLRMAEDRKNLQFLDPFDIEQMSMQSYMGSDMPSEIPEHVMKRAFEKMMQDPALYQKFKREVEKEL